MNSENESSREAVELSAGDSFLQTCIKQIEIESDVITLFHFQAKIIAHLEERSEEDVLNEMEDYRRETYELRSKGFFKRIGFSDEVLSRFEQE